MNRCEHCGAYLDSGEYCDCLDEEIARISAYEEKITKDSIGQYSLKLLNEAPAVV